MKQEYKQKLLVVYNIICDSIDHESGFEQPTLYFSHREFKKHLKTFKKRVSYERIISLGSQFANAVYINPTVRYWRENEGIIEYKNIRRGYSDYLHSLIHELVHYYFPRLEHGFEFEQKIGKLFKMIPSNEVYSRGSLEKECYMLHKETVYILCPECTCHIELCYDEIKDGVCTCRDAEHPCNYCADPANLIPNDVKKNYSW